jgi:hypothetical protein
MKPWRQKAPLTKSARQKLKSRCGSKCFLKPETLAFPICPTTSCAPVCEGLLAAFVRAKQTGRRKVARMATIRACHMKCEWTAHKGRCER